MRILILTSGSRGDVQPLLALALAMRARGHAVRFAAPPNFAGWVGELGLDFVPFGTDFKAVLEANPQIIGGVPIKLVKKMLALVRDGQKLQYAQLLPLVAHSDLVIGGGVQLAADMVCQGLNVPYGYVAYAPTILPSRFHAPIALPLELPLPGLRPALWWLNDRLWNLSLLAQTNAFRRELGLPALSNYWDAARGPAAPKLMLAAAPELAPLPADLGHVFQAGFLHHHPDQALPADLEACLDAGPPLVYAGFGSMTDPDPAATTRLMVQAARQAGVRLLVSRGWAGLGDSASEDIQVIGDLPHHLLFPRLAGVIHHGGAGTTSTAAWAGKPQLVVPHLMDQYFWARRVSRLGLGPEPLSRRTLTAPALARAIRRLVETPAYRSRAAWIGEQLRAQDGVRVLGDYLEQGMTTGPS